MNKLRNEFPNLGAGYNYTKKDEPDWRNWFQGLNKACLEILKKGI